MLDLGLTKMAVIGIVALVVVGPERLPRLARTAGALYGRMQRYVNDVKAEVSREIKLDELRRTKSEFETAARDVENTIHDTLRRTAGDLNEASQSATSSEVSAAVAGVTDASAGVADIDAGAYRTFGGTGRDESGRRGNWRIKQGAQPLWYKRASRKRRHVQSAAARLSKRKTGEARRSINFF